MSAAGIEFEWIDAVGADRVSALARVLFAAMRAFPESYASLEDAEREVRAFNAEDRTLCAARVGGEVAGWGGLIAHTPHAWELHPLCVDPAHQGSGIGRALVHELERRAAARGAITLWLGTEDEVGATNLFGEDLFPDVIARLWELELRRGHAIGFYRSLGFVVTGVIPDASGRGKHDFIMSKRLG